MLFRPFSFDGCLAYLLACPKTRCGVVIDPSHRLEAYLEAAEEMGIKITHVIDTHTHADHITLASQLAKKTGAQVLMHSKAREQRVIGAQAEDRYGIAQILEANSQVEVDGWLEGGNVVQVGYLEIKVIYTPGHTMDAICLMVEHFLFTGDTLFVGQCGRADLPGGSGNNLYESLMFKLVNLPDHLLVYPGHDYQGNVNTSLGYEKRHNPFLASRTKKDFVTFIAKFFPPLTGDGSKIQCGITKTDTDEVGEVSPLMKEMCFAMERFITNLPHDWQLISAEELLGRIGADSKVVLIDLREPHELKGGLIKGAINIPVRQLPQRLADLPEDKDIAIVLICESGYRSAHGLVYLRTIGYNQVLSLDYGMKGWREKGFPLHLHINIVL